MAGFWNSGMSEPRRGRRRAGAVIPEFVLFFLAILAVAGLAFGNWLVVSIATIVFVLTVISRLWTRLSLEEFDFKCVPFPERAFLGDKIQLAFKMENRKPFPVPWLRINQFVPAGLDVQHADIRVLQLLGGSRVRAVTSLASHQRLTKSYILTAEKRGYYPFESAVVEGGDLFGFYETKKEFKFPKGELVVYPKVLPMPGFDTPAARPLGDSLSRRVVTTDQTRPAGVRAYQPGDPVKAIDWKTTARRNEIYVRQYDPSMTTHVVILLDCNTKHPGEWANRPWLLEAEVSAAASVASRLNTLGYSVGLVTNGIPSSVGVGTMVPPGRGANHLPGILNALARVQLMYVAPLETSITELGANSLPYGATLVYIAGIFRPETVAFLAALTRQGYSLTTLNVGEADAPPLPVLNVQDYRGYFGAEQVPHA